MSQEDEKVRRATVRPLRTSLLFRVQSLVNAYITHSRIELGKTEVLQQLIKCPIYEQLPSCPENDLQTDLFLLRESVEALCLAERHDEQAALALLDLAVAKVERSLKTRGRSALFTHPPYFTCVNLVSKLGKHLARLLGDAAAEERFQRIDGRYRESRPRPHLVKAKSGRMPLQ